MQIIRISSLVKVTGIFFIAAGALINQYSLKAYLSIPFIAPVNKLILLVFNIAFILLGLFLIIRSNQVSAYLKNRNIDFIDLKKCLEGYHNQNNVSYDDMYYAGHPTSAANDALSECIINRI
ncbi:MAG: hypothetical protein AABX74_05720, partial [Nanoarchaeota archaeon]